MKKVAFLLILCFSYSCIPIRIAPNIKDNKVMIAKKFKRKLPKESAFIFKDPKDANEFYNYINILYQLDDYNVDYQVPISVSNETLFMTFYETEIPTKILNLVPIVIDAKRQSNGNDPILEDIYMTRKGNWYIILTVMDANGNDCLKSNYKNKPALISYLKDLKTKYLTTANYYDTLLKKSLD